MEMSRKTFANKASHVFKRTKSLLSVKLSQKICNKNGSYCNRGSHSGSSYLHHKWLVSQSAQATK